MYIATMEYLVSWRPIDRGFVFTLIESFGFPPSFYIREFWEVFYQKIKVGFLFQFSL